MSYCIYYEFSGNDPETETIQCIFVPGLLHSNGHAQPRFYTREVKPETPNRRWDVRETPEANYDPRSATDPDGALGHELEQFSGISSYMREALVANRELRGAWPLWLTTSDERHLIEAGDYTLPDPVEKAVRLLRLENDLPALPGA